MPKSSLARPHARTPLTPEALETLERVARTGSFAGAARELGKVPSALTYSMRALEEALDVLLFDRSSRQARLTPAGEELLREGQRLLRELDALTNRVKRVATGWESAITIAVDGIIDASALLELVRDFYRLDSPTRVSVREEILGGTWEALASGAADIAIGITQEHLRPPGIEVRRLGSVPFLFVMAATHPLAGSAAPLGEEELIGIRAIAVADSSRDSTPLTRNLLPGQQVLTLPSARLKLQAIEAGLGCGWLPEPMVRSRLREGWLHARPVAGRAPSAEFDYAWRSDPAGFGRARRWWVEQLARSEVQRNFLSCSSNPS
ncbi:MAG: LysR family transcriptional regulator [Pseudomonadota bacterium]|nr:LysR family transcriptional regulator [Pseudomonadota bacterium]